jgi:hypothetical protein
VVAGNDTDHETGLVAICQPLISERQSRLLNRGFAGRRILGIGLATQESRKARRLALVFEGVGAVDPLTGEILGTGPETTSIELLNGSWQVPSTVVEKTQVIPGNYGAGRGFVLRRDKPLEWPITCERGRESAVDYCMRAAVIWAPCGLSMRSAVILWAGHSATWQRTSASGSA